MRPNGPLSPEEIARRAPLWTALSDLFLDTEMQVVHYRAIRDAARSAGFNPGEVKSILMVEVAPVLGANLLQIAGEWAMFDPDWVVTRVRDYLAGLPVEGVISGLPLLGIQRMLSDREWPKLEQILTGETIEEVLAVTPRSPRAGAGRLIEWIAAASLIAVLAWVLIK